MSVARRHRPRIQRLIVAGLAAGVACAVAGPGRAQTAAPATRPTTAPAVIGPITYYIANCARCHGDLSAAYLGLDHPKTGKILEAVIDQMATGPSDNPLDAEGLKQQTALHEAMFRKQPFVWIDPSRKDVLAGEVLPGTTIAFQGKSGPPVAATVTDNHFEVPRRPGTLTARRDDVTVDINVP